MRLYALARLLPRLRDSQLRHPKDEYSACLGQPRVRTETFPKIRTTNDTTVPAQHRDDQLGESDRYMPLRPLAGWFRVPRGLDG